MGDAEVVDSVVGNTATFVLSGEVSEPVESELPPQPEIINIKVNPIRILITKHYRL